MVSAPDSEAGRNFQLMAERIVEVNRHGRQIRIGRRNHRRSVNDRKRMAVFCQLVGDHLVSGSHDTGNTFENLKGSAIFIQADGLTKRFGDDFRR